MKKLLLLIVLAAALTAAGVISGRGGAHNGYTANAEAYAAYERGNQQFISFQYRNAEASLNRAIELDPGFAMAHTALAHLYNFRGVELATKREIALADSLAALVPRDLDRLRVQVRLSMLEKSRYYPEADSLLAAGKAIDPDELVFLVAEAGQPDDDSDPEKAERIWKHVLEVDPNYSEAYNRLGYLYRNQGRYDEAEAAMRKYAFVAPDLANPHDSLGEVLMNVGRYEEAEAEFARALAKQPDDFPWSQVNIGKVYLQRGQVAKGVKLLTDVRQVLRGTRWERDIAWTIIRALFEHGLTTQLDEHTLHFVQAFPDDESTPYIRGMRLLIHGDVAGFRAVSDSVTTAELQDPYVMADTTKVKRINATREELAAFAATASGDHVGAAAHFQAALKLTSSAAPHELAFFRFRLAEQLHALKRDSEAMDQLEAVLSVNPRVIEALALAAEIRFAAGNRAGGMRYLEALERSLAAADADLPIVAKTKQLRAQFDSDVGGV